MTNSSSLSGAMPGLRECLLHDIAKLGRTQAYLKPSKARIVATVLGNRGLQALILHRLSHELWKKRVPVLPLILVRLMQLFFAVDIAPSAQLGPGIVIFHGFGLVIGTEVRIEGDCALYQGVTLGDRGSEWVSSTRTDGHPVVETGVIIGAGAKLLGPIRIGRHSVIGANAVVVKDVPPCSVAVGVPARVVGPNESPACREHREQKA